MIPRRILLTLAIAACMTPVHAETRIKDITSVQGARPNQLMGYGLVIGLNGSGDSLRNAPFTQQAMQSMLDRLGINIKNAQARPRNIAAVIVTAELPPFVAIGNRIDVTVSSMGDATSLAGGSLLMTPLHGPDNKIYAVAQGALSVAGFSAAGKAESVVQGVPTTGRIPNGALVEREVAAAGESAPQIALYLHNPDYRTAVNIVDAINMFSRRRFGAPLALEHDAKTIVLARPRSVTTPRLLAEIGNLLVEPDQPARVVVDERTGTIVVGKDVKISTVAVSHGSLTVRVTETPRVSQPSPFSLGQTVVTQDTNVAADQTGGHMSVVGGTNLQSLVSGLNRMGLKPTSIIAILQAIKSSGAMQADLVVQ